MSDTFDYIESYFTGRLDETERQQFEARCTLEQAFAEDVAFYIQSRAVLKEELLIQKRAAWSGGATKSPRASKSPRATKSPRAKVAKLRTYYLTAATAAAALLLFTLYLLTRPPGPAGMASKYIHTHYDYLSETLDGSRDSLQKGIVFYNNKFYRRSLDFFTGLKNNTDALLYSGLAYLQLKNYDYALQAFDTLSNMPSLYSNPGPFLKAMTLLQRNGPGDYEAARAQLQDIVRKKLDGSREAGLWLKQF